jgi:hypothetical protein
VYHTAGRIANGSALERQIQLQPDVDIVEAAARWRAENSPQYESLREAVARHSEGAARALELAIEAERALDRLPTEIRLLVRTARARAPRSRRPSIARRTSSDSSSDDPPGGPSIAIGGAQ